MRIRKIEAILKEEANRYVPDGREEIKRRVVFREQTERETYVAEPKRRRWYLVAAPIAAVLIIAVVLTIALAFPNTGNGGGGGGGQTVPVTFTESVVRVEINPSVKFNVGKDGIVTAQRALNKDGAILLMKQDFVGTNINIAAEEVVRIATKLGYLVSGKTVRLRVMNDDADLESDLKRSLGESVEKRLETLSIAADVEANGKNEIVEYLVAELGYTREEAQKMSAEDLDDILEDAFDDDSAELGEFQTEILKGVEKFLNEYHKRLGQIITMLRGIEAVDGYCELKRSDRSALERFFEDYPSEAELPEENPIEEEEFLDFVAELSDDMEELSEALEELSEDPDELSDILEDFYDRYKIYLKNHKDSLDTSESR